MPLLTIHENLKKRVLELRQRGLSYSEIQKTVSVPKSTLSVWLRGVVLTRGHRVRLEERQKRAARNAAEKRKRNRREQLSEIQRTSLRDIQQISPRELWLMGLVLYWAYGSSGRTRFSVGDVRFRSSNAEHISFFMKWLTNIGRIKRDDIVFDIFIREKEKRSLGGVVQYWSRMTGYSPRVFSRVYMLKSGVGQGIRRKRKYYGLLQIRIRKSSLLKHQLDGWMNGIMGVAAGSGLYRRESRSVRK